MQASAIRAAAANFRTCLEAIWPLAQRRNVPRQLFDQLLAGVTPDLRIMDLLDSQPEFTKAPWEYLDILVTDARIADGRAILAKHRAPFDAMERAYGVDRHVIAAIWGIEFELRHGDRRPLGDPFDRDARPASAAGRTISATNCSPRWRSSRAATSASSICAAPGRARSGRRNSCRRPTAASRSMPTATAGAMSWSRCPISSPRRRTTSSAKAGSPDRAGATRSSCRAASISCSPTAAR